MDLGRLLELLEGVAEFVARHNRTFDFARQRNRRVRERVGLPAEKIFRTRKLRKRRMKRRMEASRKARLKALGAIKG